MIPDLVREAREWLSAGYGGPVQSDLITRLADRLEALEASAPEARRRKLLDARLNKIMSLAGSIQAIIEGRRDDELGVAPPLEASARPEVEPTSRAADFMAAFAEHYPEELARLQAAVAPSPEPSGPPRGIVADCSRYMAANDLPAPHFCRACGFGPCRLGFPETEMTTEASTPMTAASSHAAASDLNQRGGAAGEESPPTRFDGVRITSADFNGHTWDGSPFDYPGTIPGWFAAAYENGSIKVEPDDRDYATWRVLIGDNCHQIAEPGNWIVNFGGHLAVLSSDAYRAIRGWPDGNGAPINSEPGGDVREAAIADLIDFEAMHTLKGDERSSRWMFQERRDRAVAAATRILALPSISKRLPSEEGWVLVPVEPTEAMINAGDAIDVRRPNPSDVWTAMIAASPSAPIPSEEADVNREGEG